MEKINLPEDKIKKAALMKVASAYFCMFYSQHKCKQYEEEHEYKQITHLILGEEIDEQPASHYHPQEYLILKDSTEKFNLYKQNAMKYFNITEEEIDKECEKERDKFRGF